MGVDAAPRWSVHPPTVKGEQLTLEGLAERIRTRAGLAETELISSLTVARRVMGVPVLVLPTLPTQACLVVHEGRYRIVLREIDVESHFAVAHELGHWALRTIDRYRGPDEERFANYIAGAITVPLPLVRSAMSNSARPIKPLARTTGVSQTAAALRIAEAMGPELVVVTGRRRNVIQPAFCGPRGLDWACDREHVRQVADRAVVDETLETEKLAGGIDQRRVVVKLK